MATKSVAQIAASINRQYGALEQQGDAPDVFAGDTGTPSIRFGRVVQGEIREQDELIIQVGTASEISMDTCAYPLTDLYHWLTSVASDYYGREGTLVIGARWEPADGVVEGDGIQVIEEEQDDDEEEE